MRRRTALRVLQSVLVAALLLVGLAPAAWAAPTVVLDSLTIPAAAPGQSISATARVHTAGGSLTLQAITVAVRQAGTAYDFPGATSATITSSGYTFTSGARAFAAGTYDVFVAVQVNGVWTDLSPHTTMTIAAPQVVLDNLSIPPVTTGASVAATAQVHASSGSVTVQAITVAVRQGSTAFDFPGATAATIPASGYRFTSGARSFAAGTYTAFVAVQVGGSWTSLNPATTFTVGAADNPLVFDQEFNGPSGAGPNDGLSSPVWTTDPCWQNGCTGTLAQYKDANAALDGQGDLVLTADRNPDAGAMCGSVRCTYSAARLTMLDWAAGGVARRPILGGHWEARIKMPAGTGLWPAWWTVGANQATVDWPASGEIDVLEVLGQSPAVIEQHAHGSTPAAPNTDVSVAGGNAYTLPAGGSSTGWHTYALDWDPSASGYLKWSVDGVLTFTVTAADAGAAWRSFRGAQSMILNLAVGGDWPGPPDAATVFPARMQIDWIRVNQRATR